MLRLTRLNIFWNQTRLISISTVKSYKEIKVEENDTKIVVEAVAIESPRTKNLVPHQENCATCPLCRWNLRNLAYSDVLILSQFIETNGTLMHRSVTGLCARSHAKVKKLVEKAQSAKLLPRPPDYVSFGPWDELPKYFEQPRRIRDRPLHVVKPEYWK